MLFQLYFKEEDEANNIIDYKISDHCWELNLGPANFEASKLTTTPIGR